MTLPKRDSSARTGAGGAIFRGVSGAAFVLIETMMAVAIFGIGVIALGRCVEHCLLADIAKQEENRARLALANEMAIVEAGARPPSDKYTEELKGMFAGMTLTTRRAPLKEKNEKGQDIIGISQVTITVAWKSGAQELSRELNLYVAPRQQQ